MTTPQARSGPDLDLSAGDEIYGPQFPDQADLYRAQDAPLEADRAGCSDAVYDRLMLERQQTEVAYLDGYGRDLVRDLEAESADPEAGLGHDYDGPELRSGTPEYEALYAEYQAWVAQPEPEPEAEPGAGPVPYTLTPRAEAVLASWDRFHALERAERAALGEAEPEPEAEL